MNALDHLRRTLKWASVPIVGIEMVAFKQIHQVIYILLGIESVHLEQILQKGI